MESTYTISVEINGQTDSMDISVGVDHPDWDMPVTEINAPQGMWHITYGVIGTQTLFHVQQAWNPRRVPDLISYRYRRSFNTETEAIAYVVGCVETMQAARHNEDCDKNRSSMIQRLNDVLGSR